MRVCVCRMCVDVHVRDVADQVGEFHRGVRSVFFGCVAFFRFVPIVFFVLFVRQICRVIAAVLVIAWGTAAPSIASFAAALVLG